MLEEERIRWTMETHQQIPCWIPVFAFALHSMNSYDISCHAMKQAKRKRTIPRFRANSIPSARVTSRFALSILLPTKSLTTCACAINCLETKVADAIILRLGLCTCPPLSTTEACYKYVHQSFRASPAQDSRTFPCESHRKLVKL